MNHVLRDATDTYVLQLWGALAGVNVMKRKLKHGPAITTVDGVEFRAGLVSRNGKREDRATRRANFLTRNPTILNALNIICNVFGVTLDELHGRHRYAHVVAVRKATALLLRDIFRLSYPEIAFAMNYLDHTSSMLAESLAIDLIERDSTFAKQVRTARQLINDQLTKAPTTPATHA